MYAYVVKATANERKDESLPSEQGDVCYHFYFLKGMFLTNILGNSTLLQK